MAEEENKNISTALAIVEKQQNIVGSAIVGASGTTNFSRWCRQGVNHKY